MASQRPPLPRRRINGAHPHHAPRSTRQGGEPTPTTRRRLNPDGIAERFTYLHQTAGRDPLTSRRVVARATQAALCPGGRREATRSVLAESERARPYGW